MLYTHSISLQQVIINYFYLCTMRLRSLQIKGFKSFANDTLLNFSENVIGVVGPNGSGKSNIVDAIRWVLGEQKSKELRLDAMSDVIFNGTKTKKEAPTATVSLTFDNTKNILPTEYQTVTISRTLYRTGESEYRLNNVICRLKDINSLFLDTGIGSNSYAIIALGMVDDILDDKENARRRMFEQAAGISKYKVRKRETLNKLKSASEDLNRIDDLLFEIEGNLKSLEKQAKRTQKYLDLKAEYKELSIKHAVTSIQKLKAQYKSISDQLVKDQDEYRLQDAVLYKLEAQLAKDKKENTDKEVILSDQQKRLNDLVYQIRTRENDKGLLTQKAGFKKQNKEHLQKSITANESELEKIHSDNNALVIRISDENLQLEKLNQLLQSSSIAYEAIKTEYQTAKISFDSRQKEKQDLEKQTFEIEKQIAIFRNTVENIENETHRIKELLEYKTKEKGEYSKSLEAVNAQLESKDQELTNFIENDNNRKQKIIELELKRDNIRDEVNKINRNLDSKQNEYDLLKSMIDNFEGFPESIKFLNENWKKDIPLLSDLLDVKEEYKAPLELYLDQYLNYYVVQTQKEAIQGINLLKNSQKGKANFFITNQILPKKPVKVNDLSLIKATDVVRTHENYKILIDALLANVYIYDGDVEELESSDNENVTIISSKGTFLKKGFSISGGSVGLFEGKKIGRRQNLEKLSVFIESNTKTRDQEKLHLEKLIREIEQLKSSDLHKTIESLKGEINSISKDKVKLDHQIQTFESFKSENEQKLKLIRQQMAEHAEKITAEEQKVKSIKKKIAELIKPDQNQNTDMDQMAETLSAASEKYNTDNINLIRHQNLIANFIKDKEFKELKLSELNLKLNNERDRLLSEDRERIDIEDQLIKLDTELQTLYSEKKNFQSTLSQAEQDFFSAKNNISTLEDSIRDINRHQAKLQQTIQNLKDKYSEQKFQIQSIAERIRIEFNASINDFINQNIEIEDGEFETMSGELEKIKTRMSSYGDINPLAVEAYNEMKIRYDNIEVQRKDILDAKDSLMDTMKEIETTATHQFMEAFGKVRENFITVFRNLFTEDDTCDLILLDPSNPLESEIEIIAKPKGKKPKSLSQLSGGEKTLTATALLFALYLLKPAPFCIFDEVDAPLDDANIQKFNKIIQKFSNESQFIIVTHNKSTMAEVDVLYGVYMNEPGISAVSQVDFRSLKHEPILENIT
jgi:chromosome segregation protein